MMTPDLSGPHFDGASEPKPERHSLTGRVLHQVEEQRPQNSHHQTSTPHFVPQESHRRKFRILVVDDDPDVLNSTREFLTEAGYEVLTACDGAEALARIERDHPDWVLLDIVMPHRTGLAVLEQIKCLRRKTPKVVLTTANTNWEPTEWLKLKNVVAFLPKPFDSEALLLLLKAHQRDLQPTADPTSLPSLHSNSSNH